MTTSSRKAPVDTPALLSKSLRMSYRIGRGEQGVLTFEPYKSALLPFWRFKTVDIARKSSADLWDRFVAYETAGDFVGADMARKFIQMGMTRAARYANHKGGRKYDKKTGVELERSEGHDGMDEKRAASDVFRETWNTCKEREEYQRLKREFMAEQKEWDKTHKKRTR